MRPELFILAGPNGAGKSTYGHMHVPAGTFLFNGDLVYAELLKRYPNYDPIKLQGGVPAQLDKDKAEAIAQRTNFAVETNYSVNMSIEITRDFIKEGYHTTLIYFGLNNLYEATSRVETRIKFGGHDVPMSEIKRNYEFGQKQVRENLHLYDRVLFVDTSILGTAPTIAYYNSINGKHEVIKDVKWFSENFKQPLLNLAASRISEIKKEIPQTLLPKKGKDPGEDLGHDLGGPGLGM
jgi:predicted ABC-type ATPase